MKVFMLGWEFPPFISGGLGTACYGLTKAMDRLGVEVTFVLPRMVEGQYANHVKLLNPGSVTSAVSFKVNEFKNVAFRAVNSPLQPYSRPDVYSQKVEDVLREKKRVESGKLGGILVDSDYSGNMYSEVRRYATVAVELAKSEQFDVIHAHDWMTFPAGIAVAAISGKPLIVQIHSTEFDRSGEHVNQAIYDIEREGMYAADKVIAVSNYTSRIIQERYGVYEGKIEVVHNGIERNNGDRCELVEAEAEKDEKIVLFMGRITMQKGPEYFLEAAKKVLGVMENVKFVMAGSGDLMRMAVEKAAELGIGSKVHFTGFLRGEEVQKIYKMADLFVMPSVSEPFGLVPLEALDNDVPVIISKQSGVSEVLTHALKVDFWDVDEMANKIVAVLKYKPLQSTLKDYGNFEVRKLHWNSAAAKCIKIYDQMMVAV